MNANIQAQLDRLTAATTAIEAKLASAATAASDADNATQSALEPVVVKLEADAK